MGGLIGVATAERDGLISRTEIINNFQMGDFGSSDIYRIAGFSYFYKAICIRGLETTSGKEVNIFIYRGGNTTLLAKGSAISGLTIKKSSDNILVYMSVKTGVSISCRIEAMGSNNIVNAITKVDSFPSDAIDIPFT